MRRSPDVGTLPSSRGHDDIGFAEEFTGLAPVSIRIRVDRKQSVLRRQRILWLLLAAAAACLLAFVFAKGIRNSTATTFLRVAAWAGTPESIQKVEPAKYQRITYPYSVVPNGVHSREELIDSINNDPIIAAHFADFDVGQARIDKAQETQLVYVSYRMRNGIFWTAKTIKLPEGETLITDGHSVVRARCGNRISAVPQQPTSSEEPLVETFDIPMLAKLEQH